MSDVIDNISNACNELGDVDLSGIRLSEGDPRLLDLTHFTLDVHVAMQPAAVAYYNSLQKEAGRRLEQLNRQYNRWRVKRMAEARVSVENGTKAVSTIKSYDIEARYVADHEPAIEEWENKIDKAQKEYDTMTVWCDAWRQKSFSMKEFVTITEDERFNSVPSLRGNGNSEHRPSAMDRVRGIMKDSDKRHGSR